MCFHATFKTADFREIADDSTSYITLEDDRSGVKICAVHVPDDSAYAPSKEELGTIPADISSFGKITLPHAAVDLLIDGESDRGPSVQAEEVEIFISGGQIFIYLDGARLYTFDDATTQAEQAYKKAQEEHEKEREDSTGEITPEDVEKPWKDVKQEIDFAGVFRSFSYLWDAKTGAACIEYGNLYVTSKKGIAVRFFGNRDLTTGNISRWVNTWKTEKAGIFEQYAETGSAWINDQKAPLLDRPRQLRFNGAKRIDPLFPRDEEGEVLVYTHEAAPLARLLKKEKAGAFFSVGYKQKHLQQNIAFNVGAVKKSLAYFTTEEGGPVVSVCLRNGVYYLVITSDWKLLDGEFDIIPAQKVTEYSVLAFNFELNTLEPSKIAPKIDASTPAAKDATPANEAPKTQENATQENETKQAEKTTPAGAAFVLSSDDLRGDNFGKTLESVKNALTQGAKQEQKKEATWDGFLNHSKEVWINIAMSTGRFPMKVIYFPSEKIGIVKHKKTWYAIEAITGSAFYSMPNFHDLLNTLRHPENRTPILALIESVRSKNPALNPIDEAGNILDISPAEYEKMQAEGPKAAEKPEEKPEPAERPSVRASEPAPVESAPQPSAPAPAEPTEDPQPQPSEPSADDEPSGAEKPFEIGTYTTKKGKVKTAIKFNVTPRPEWIEALKTAYFWEYNGTWNGSPRKLPEIFKH